MPIEASDAYIWVNGFQIKRTRAHEHMPYSELSRRDGS